MGPWGSHTETHLFVKRTESSCPVLCMKWEPVCELPGRVCCVPGNTSAQGSGLYGDHITEGLGSEGVLFPEVVGRGVYPASGLTFWKV